MSELESNLGNGPENLINYKQPTAELNTDVDEGSEHDKTEHVNGQETPFNVFSSLEQHKDEYEKLKWDGSFEDYVEMLQTNPEISRTAYQTVYNAISQEGFFTTGKNALHGADKATKRFIEVMKAGAEGYEVGKRIILLLGPPGSGKSTLVNGTKAGIEAYSKTDEGAMYSIADCPMNEDPLHLVPEDLRPQLEEAYGVHIEGNLCPHCEDKYGNDFDAETLKSVRVKRFVLSQQKRQGIGTFEPSDPKSQDVTELVGSVDYSKIGEFGSGSDPKAYRFDGEFNVANRGVMEFVEMLKSDEKFLYLLLNLTQDRLIKSPRFAPISADEVILAHTNLAEYERYMNDPRNEALRDRIVKIEVPYTLEYSQERKIHEKLIGQSEKVQESGIHINPLALETASTFAVLSRIKETKYSKKQKMLVYDGQNVDGLSQRDAKEMHGERAEEGMSGISPRYVIDSLSLALTQKKEDEKCLTPMDTIIALRDNLDTHPHTSSMNADEKNAIKEDLNTAKQIYDDAAKKEVQRAFMESYEDTARTMADKYLSNIDIYINDTKATDPYSGEEIEPDEGLMRSIEEQIGITDNGKKEFRTEILTKMGSAQRQGSEFDYSSHPRLKEAIEKKLFGDMKDMVKLTTSTAVPNEKQKKKIKNIENTLVEERGYCEHCARDLVQRVGSLLSQSGN